MRLRNLLPAVLLACTPALAQDSEEDRDRGFIVGLIEDNLSAPGLSVRLDGFEGALSSRATLDLLQVSDDEGAWLRLEDVVLDWDRGALLRGRLEVEELSAARIIVERAPLPAEGVEALPEAGASGFSLPDLPVSVNVDVLRADRIELGAPLLGERVALTLEAAAELADGSGQVTLNAERLDGPIGRFAIAAGFDATTETLALDLDISEAQGGLAATLLQLPGAPGIDLTVAGAGPLDDFMADIAVASDGVDRLSGQLTLDGVEDGRAFAADLGGDVTALFAPQFQPFFGDNVALVARGVQRDDGSLSLDRFLLDTQALTLGGTAQIGADGWPSFVDIEGRLASTDGTAVLLPTASESRMQQAALLVAYDAAQSDAFSLTLTAQDYVSPDTALDDLRVTATGRIARDGGVVQSARAAIAAVASGLDLSDPNLAQAVGEDVTLRTDLDWTDGAPIRLSELDLNAGDLSLAGQVALDTAGTGLPITLDITADAPALTRLSGLAGLPLEGRADLSLSGTIAPVAGTFDLALDASTTDLALDVPQVDPLLAGQSQLTIRTRRTADGTFLDNLTLANGAITASGSAVLLDEEVEGRSRATFQAELADGTPIDPRLAGTLSLAVDAAQNEQGQWEGTLDAAAPQDVTVNANGILTGAPDINFAATIPELSAFMEGVPGRLALTGRARADGGTWSLDAQAAGPWDLSASVSGPVTGPAPHITFNARLPDLTGPVPAIADIPALAGEVALSGTLSQTNDIWAIDSAVAAPSDITLRLRGPVTGTDARVEFAATLPEISAFTDAVSGRLDLDGAVARMGDDWAADLVARGPIGARVTAESVLTRSPLRVGFAADIPDLSELAPVPGGLSVAGEALQTEDGFRITLDGTGPYRASIDADIELGADGPRIAANGQIPNAAALAPQLNGPLNYDVTARQQDGQWVVSGDIDGAQGLRASVSGLATGPEADLTFSARAANVAPFAPGLSGPLDASGRLFQRGGDWNIDVDASGPLGARLDASGRVTGTAPEARFTLAVPNIAPLVPELPGPLRVEGTARQQGSAWALDIDADGPGGTQARVTGQVLSADNLNLSITGAAPLGLANSAIAPRRVAGTANFDLQVVGPPAPESLGGTISASGAALSLPTLRNGIEGIDAEISLQNGSATLEITGGLQTGGRVALRGSVGLAAPFNADLTAGFDVDIEDPTLYTIETDGDITITGPLTGGARIAGEIEIDGAEIIVPSSGITAIGNLPPIEHLSSPRPVRRTLERAGQLDRNDEGSGSNTAGPSYTLDITVEAPGRIFVRGRGLDAELGGTIRVAGTTLAPIVSGGFELLRGRLDILQRRFDLDEGTVTFQGGLLPFVRLVAVTETDILEASIIVEGPADAVEVSFESTPEVAEEEVVSQIFFGRGLDQLSPLQAVQLANSIATLAGRGSGGLIDNIRGTAGLDDLDITTDADGGVAVSAGKYISDNVYTDVEVNQDGDATISLNLDVTSNLTVRGATSPSGDQTSLGLFFERDY